MTASDINSGESKLLNELKLRRARVIAKRDEPAMDDFDAGIRAAACEEISFLDKILNQYGRAEERENTSST